MQISLNHFLIIQDLFEASDLSYCQRIGTTSGPKYYLNMYNYNSACSI